VDVGSGILVDAAVAALEGQGLQLASLTPSTNQRILSVRGEEEGREFLERSGRIDGWFVDLVGEPSPPLPAAVQLNVVLFQTAAGPRVLMDEAGGPCRSEREPFLNLDHELDLGDRSALCFQPELAASDPGFQQYWIPIAYRNVFLGVGTFGSEAERDWLIAAAGALLEAIERLPHAAEMSLPEAP
jgi:hypothetical protein